MESRFIITSKQLIFILIGSQIATGIFSLPRLVTTEAGTHGWLAVIVGAIPAYISIWLIVNLGNKFPGQNFVGLSKQLFGKYLGSFLVIAFIIYIVIYQSIVIRIFVETTSLYMLPSTPIPVILFLVQASVVYIVMQGGKVIGRLNELLFYISVAILLLLLCAFSQADCTNILPLGDIDLGGLWQGALSASYAYAGTEVLLVVFFMVNNKDKALKAALTGQTIVLVIYFIVVVLSILVFGIYAMEEMLRPLLILLKGVEFPLFDRLELFFLSFWMGLGIRPVINLGLAAAYSSSMLINRNFNYYKIIVLLTGILMYFIALIPKNVLQAMEWSVYIGYVYLGVALSYPLLYSLLGFLRRDKKHEF